MEKEPITIQGLEKLKEELIFLKEKKRPEIVSAISPIDPVIEERALYEDLRLVARPEEWKIYEALPEGE